MENLRAFLLLNKVREEAEVLSFTPEDVESNPDSANYIIDNGFLITFRAPDNNAVLHQIESAINVQSYEVIDGQGAHEAEKAPEKQPEAQPAPTAVAEFARRL